MIRWWHFDHTTISAPTLLGTGPLAVIKFAAAHILESVAFSPFQKIIVKVTLLHHPPTIQNHRPGDLSILFMDAQSCEEFTGDMSNPEWARRQAVDQARAVWKIQKRRRPPLIGVAVLALVYPAVSAPLIVAPVGRWLELALLPAAGSQYVASGHVV